MDKATIEALAEAYWTQHVAPVMRRLTIDAFLSGSAALPTAFHDWIAAMPGNHAGGGPAAAADMPVAAEASGGEEAAAGDEAAFGDGAPEGGPDPVAPPPARQLKGLSAATYEIVMRAGRPMLSRELLNALRKRDGVKPTPARDNTLLASMRRLRKAGIIGWDGTHYSPMPAGTNDAQQPGADGRSGE